MTALLDSFFFWVSFSGDVAAEGIVVTVCVITEPLIVTICVPVMGVGLAVPKAEVSCHGRVSDFKASECEVQYVKYQDK